MRLVHRPRSGDVRSVILVTCAWLQNWLSIDFGNLVVISAAFLWFIIGNRANEFTHRAMPHVKLNIELWVIVSVFVAVSVLSHFIHNPESRDLPLYIKTLSGWFQKGEKEWELRGLLTEWRPEKQGNHHDESVKPLPSASLDRIVALVLWTGVPFLLFAALFAVWPDANYYEHENYKPMLLLLIPVIFALAIPMLPSLAYVCLI